MPMMMMSQTMVLPSEMAVIRMFFEGVMNSCIFQLDETRRDETKER